MKIGYALFNKKDGKLYPQYVWAKNEIPMGVWLEANEDAKWYIDPKNGRKYLAESKLGRLAWRPGKHLATVPLFNQIGKKVDGKLLRRKDTVICEVEYVDDVDYTAEAHERSRTLHNGKEIPYDCCLDHLPYNGFYYFNTNTRAKVQWVICHKYRVVRELTNEEVEDICRENGVEPQEVAS